jgi:2-succinyl-5-enolpyruvyl-6-hydroxy-3-cyclohexene-1-carboxylate synthase
VVEADAADLPLLLLTADRPLELAGSGANQTIDQVRFYGSRTRLALDLDCGDGSDLQLRAVRRQLRE